MSCCGNCTPEHLDTLGNDPYVTVPAPRRDTDTVQCHVTTLGNYGVGKSSLIYHTTTTTSPDAIRKKGISCWLLGQCHAAFRARHSRLVVTCVFCVCGTGPAFVRVCRQVGVTPVTMTLWDTHGT